MSLEAMRTAVARLLTDPTYRRRFFTDGLENHARYHLTAGEFASLKTIDARMLGIVSEGYAGKRFERIESAFRRTLAALESLEPDTRSLYLARTAFPSDDATERATFIRYLETNPGTSEPIRRFLGDLAAVERVLYETPVPGQLPAFRLRPDVSRPRRAGEVLTAHLQGPLDRGWKDPPAVPQSYAELAHDVLVVRDGAAIELLGLDGPMGRLLMACDGSRTIVQLAQEFGVETPRIIDRWLRLRIVEDTATS